VLIDYVLIDCVLLQYYQCLAEYVLFAESVSISHVAMNQSEIYQSYMDFVHSEIDSESQNDCGFREVPNGDSRIDSHNGFVYSLIDSPIDTLLLACR
jgi:hypothetical protein